MTYQDPHATTPLVQRGSSVANAKGAVVLVHGRGASAQSMLPLADALAQPEWLYVAPQAAGHTWYPYSFLAPMAENEPGLSSGLQRVSTVIDDLIADGLAPERIVLLGFSQGACLALEAAARRGERLGGVIAFSGGLIGPPGTPREYDADLQGTPVFLGCSDVDAHIPLGRVHESADVFERLGADVTKRVYRGMGHTINADELAFARGLLAKLGADEAINAQT
ncbi:MAG: dienelactone hydrolase family protein [Rhodothermales bacterium]